MPVKPSLVVNSSPLIALVAALPDFDQLAGIVGRFIVPAEVIAELVAGGLKDETAARVQAASWCEVRSPRPSAPDPLLQRLGGSEAAVIQTAQEEGLPLVVIDELRGDVPPDWRACASSVPWGCWWNCTTRGFFPRWMTPSGGCRRRESTSRLISFRRPLMRRRNRGRNLSRPWLDEILVAKMLSFAGKVSRGENHRQSRFRVCTALQRVAARWAKGPSQASPGQARDERRPGNCRKRTKP